VHAELDRRGYDAGAGRWRDWRRPDAFPRSMAFQADHGLVRTGTINESLLRALDLD
jgi:hypothetical protein